MEELSIIYQNANYGIRYEKKERIPFRHKNEVIKFGNYRIYFDDLKLQEQFGNPVALQNLPAFDILLACACTPAAFKAIAGHKAMLIPANAQSHKGMPRNSLSLCSLSPS